MRKVFLLLFLCFRFCFVLFCFVFLLRFCYSVFFFQEPQECDSDLAKEASP